MSDVRISVGSCVFLVAHVLMITVASVGGLVHLGAIEEIERDLTMVIDDFERAVDLEVLQRMKETGEHSFLVRVHSHLLRCR